MTRTEERLAEALDAAARALREDTLSPLIVPERRPRTRPAWAAPLAAAGALLLAVGLGAAVSGHLPGIGRSAAPVVAAVGPPPRYYVETESGQTLVRATATGAVTGTVPVSGLVTAAADGEFFIVAGTSSAAYDLYRFRLNASGQVTGLSLVTRDVVSQGVEAEAASADGSVFAVAVNTLGSAKIVVVNTVTGARSVWQGGMDRPGYKFGIASLSWTSNGELVFLGQWCSRAGTEVGVGTCATIPAVNAMTPSDSQVWALDHPTAGGGLLDSGRMLLGQSAQFPSIMQAVISPDGSTLTAIVVNQPASFTRSPVALAQPGSFSVDQASVATGGQLGTLYQGSFGWENAWQLSSDGAAGHWLIDGDRPGLRDPGLSINGWIANGRLTALPPSEGVYSEAWWSPPPAAIPAPVSSPAPTRVAPSLAGPGPAPSYYVETYATDSTGQVVVRSTATGAVTADVGIPPSAGPLVSAAGDGTFFAAARVSGQGPMLYRFRLTGSGQVAGLSAVPGGVIGGARDVPDAIAVSPDGSQVAVALGPAPSPSCSQVAPRSSEPIASPLCDGAEPGKGADDIVVINVATGTRRLWAGGMPDSLYIPSLSWTANGRELVFLGQTCQAGAPWFWGENGCTSGTAGETFGVWALNPEQAGGRLDSGRLLLRQAPEYLDVAQALISGDGSTITAAVVTGPPDQPVNGPVTVSFEQISVGAGTVLRVLYHLVVSTMIGKGVARAAPRYDAMIGVPVPMLNPVATGQSWLVGRGAPCFGAPQCPKQPVLGWTADRRLFVLPALGEWIGNDAW
jgi:hypothetical protein